MQVYNAPLRDMRFVLNELHIDDGFGDLPDFEEVTPDLTEAVLEEAAKVCRDVLLPLNRLGDEEGLRVENGSVRTPAGFADAQKLLGEGGWTSLAVSPEWGGQGLPHAVNNLVEEMLCSTNVAYSLCPGLTHGAAKAIEGYATRDLQERYLPGMVSGKWSGTMCLTEAQCGTDLGLLRTAALPVEDGSYRVSGSKIFITWGDHDLTENIIHLVLARLPDAPAGVKGISLFLVPKFLLKEDGTPGEFNNVLVRHVEHKMGIMVSPTCQLDFDKSVGWMVGEPHRGLEAMFKMMNVARVGVGLQGLGIGEAAYQSAAWYAKDRVQGRSVAGVKRPDLPADPIIVHPDVRRMLMIMRANNEGCRALSAWISRAIDAESHAADPAVRERAGDFVALMTPVVKALFTDLGFETANHAVQVYGGHGYIRESGVEQFVRDARIAMLYEGTNGIQALDLVGRKLPAHGGRYLRSLFHPISAFIEANGGEGPLKPLVTALQQAFGALQLATGLIAERGLKDREEGSAAATDYLRLMGLVAMGFCFAKAAKIAVAKVAEGGEDSAFYATKLKTATFYFERVLPQATACFLAIKAGKASMMAFDEGEF